MGKLVGIPDYIWMRMTDEQKEEYYKQQKKNNIIVGIIVGITFFVSFTLLLLMALNV